MTCPPGDGHGDDSSTGASPAPEKKLTANEAIRAFLQLALLPPEKLPKQQYRQRENQAQIIGFNRAQEALRQILKEHGAGEDLKALAEVRADGQQVPIQVGDLKAWVMS